MPIPKDALRRDSASPHLFDNLRQDVHFGVRSAMRAPLFFVLALFTLAVGIGANAAVFGVVKSVLLDRLPYTDAGRLVRVFAHPASDPSDRQGISPGLVMDIAERQRSFSSLAAFYHTTMQNTYVGESGPRIMKGALVGPGFFQTLGVQPAVGRALGEADAKTGAPPVAMLSYDAWQREFGGDARVVGKSLRLDGDATEVVGVLPRGFVGPMGEADVWYPLDLGPALADAGGRGSHWLGIIARLKVGVDADAARRELAAIGVNAAAEHPKSEGGRSLMTVPLRESMVGDTRTILLILMASAALVLLIMCANLAGALLSRTIARRKEFAVRVALGAGRGRLVTQLLTESLLLSFMGGAAGLVLARVALSMLRTFGVSALPPYADLSLDGGAVLATGLIALLTGLAFGVAPALYGARSHPQGVLREETRGTSESRKSRTLHGILVAAQIALSLSLLTGSGLLVRSLWTMASTPLGIDPKGVLTVAVRLNGPEYDSPEARTRMFDQLEERARTLPGVTRVATTTDLPSPDMNRNSLEIEGVTLPVSDGPTFIPYASVSDDYFPTLQIPVVRGRTFTRADVAGAQPVIVISETMEKRYWPNGNALGAHIRISPHTSEQWGEVIGIVGDVRSDPASLSAEPMAYGSSRQDASRHGRTYLLRTPADPHALAAPFQRELTKLDRGLPVRDVATMEELLADVVSARKLPAVLITVFGGLALLLVSVGVYGMFASMAAAREREFGIRAALGSTPSAIAGLVVRQGAMWLGIGLIGGLAGVVVTSGLVRDLLYRVNRFDPLALGVAFGALLACATFALLVPVRRAARVDATSILR